MSELKDMPKVFLGATSENGFVNRFADVYKEKDWRVYIIKGGPGCGKSTFMMRIANDFADKNPILCHCSSDVDSLDAVVFSDIKVMIADGTSPHILEPKLPAVKERILNFFDILDSEKLYKKRYEIEKAFCENASYHKTAANYIKTAGVLLRDRLKTAKQNFNQTKAENYAKSLAKRLIKKSGKDGNLLELYLDAVTPDGYVSFDNTAEKLAKNVIAFDDSYGCVANCMLKILAEKSVEYGQQTIVALNPILPTQIRGVIIPESEIAVCVSDFLSSPKNAKRTIHAKRFYNEKMLRQNKLRLSFDRRASLQMIDEASKTLRLAKLSHDKLERYYISAANFSKVKKIYKKLAKEIISL